MSKKKLLILHVSNTLNYGSMMMATNFIHYFDKLIQGKYVYYVDNESDKEIERLIDSTLIDRIKKMSQLGFDVNPVIKGNKSIITKIKYYISMIKGYGNKLKANGINNVVILGGDDL